MFLRIEDHLGAVWSGLSDRERMEILAALRQDTSKANCELYELEPPHVRGIISSIMFDISRGAGCASLEAASRGSVTMSDSPKKTELAYYMEVVEFVRPFGHKVRRQLPVDGEMADLHNKLALDGYRVTFEMLPNGDGVITVDHPKQGIDVATRIVRDDGNQLEAMRELLQSALDMIELAKENDAKS